MNLSFPVKVWLAFSKATFELKRASLSVPLDTELAFKLVRLAPDSTGKIPPAVSWTSWFAPLKVLPCRVTWALKRALFSVPLDILVALRLVKPAPLPVKLLLALLKLFAPVKVWLPFSLARLALSLKLDELIWVPFI